MADPITERTKFSGELKGMLVMAAAILAGGVSAGVAATQLMQRVSSLEQKVSQLPTKDDLREARRLRSAYVLCPARGRTGEFVKCNVVQGENEP
jgi:hypothetical protein